jgi:hypothetical protein
MSSEDKVSHFPGLKKVKTTNGTDKDAAKKDNRRGTQQL